MKDNLLDLEKSGKGKSGKKEASEKRDISAKKGEKEKCKYGEKCYNKKEEHRKRFSHPGDQGNDVVDGHEEQDAQDNQQSPKKVDIADKEPDSEETQEMGTADLERLLNKKRHVHNANLLAPVRSNSVNGQVLDDSSEEEKKVPAKKRKTEEKKQEESKDDGKKDEDKQLPLCAFGASCYRKNPAHFAEYRHE